MLQKLWFSRWRQLSLLTQISVPVAAVLLAGTLGSYAYSSHRAEVTAQQWSDALVRSAASVSGNALLLNDLAQVESALSQLAKLPGVLGIELLDAKGVPILRMGQRDQELQVEYKPKASWISANGAPTPVGLRPFKHDERAAMLSWRPVVDDVDMGTVAVAYTVASADPLGEQIEQIWIHFLLGGATLITLMLFLRANLKPLGQLAASTRSADNQKALSEDQANCHEVATLTEAINLLNRRLNNQIQKLSFSEANLRASLEGSPDGFLLLSPTGRVQLMNAACRAMLRVDTDDYLQANIRRWLPDFSLNWADMSGVNTAGEASFSAIQTQAMRHGTEPFPVEISLSFVDAGGASQYICVLRDVSERQRTRQQLAERTARFHAVVDLSPDGIALFDARNQLVFANPALGEMLGWEEAIQWSDLSLDKLAHFFTEISADGTGFRPIGDGLESDEPETLTLAKPRHRVLARSWRRNLGGQQETVMYFRDITHESEVDRMKSEFLNSATHELRTPLASVMGFSELMLKRQLTPERQRELITTIYQQSKRLSTIINELLDLARIESRRGQDFVLQAHTLHELVSSTVDGLLMPNDSRQVQVKLHDEQALLWVDIDKSRQALLNLLSNAYKYSPNGGAIELTSEAVHTKAGRHMVALTVKDHGTGLTPEQQNHLFERFWRADSSGHIPGTGLGMCLVKEIVELQQGSVRVQSEYGVGTEVTILLPMPTRKGEPHPSV